MLSPHIWKELGGLYLLEEAPLVVGFEVESLCQVLSPSVSFPTCCLQIKMEIFQLLLQHHACPHAARLPAMMLRLTL